MKILSAILFSVSAFAQTPQFPAALATDQNLKVAVNGVTTLLTADITTGQTTLPITSCAGIVPYTLVTIDQEIMDVTGCSGTVLIVDQRGFDGTPAATHAQASPINAYVDAWHHNSLSAEVQAIESTLGVNLSHVNGAGPCAVITGTPVAGDVPTASSGVNPPPCTWQPVLAPGAYHPVTQIQFGNVDYDPIWIQFFDTMPNGAVAGRNFMHSDVLNLMLGQTGGGDKVAYYNAIQNGPSATSPLTAGMNNSQLTIPVSNSGIIPNNVFFGGVLVKIDSELMYACGTSAGQITVCALGRGAVGTTPASHLSGALVHGLSGTWAQNTLCNKIPGVDDVGNNCVEIDYNNLLEDWQGLPGQLPSVGMEITSGATFRPLTGLVVNSNSATNGFQVPIWVGSNSNMGILVGPQNPAPGDIGSFAYWNKNAALLAMQLRNGGDGIVIYRATDTAPTGPTFRIVNNADTTNLFLIDVNGNIITPALYQTTGRNFANVNALGSTPGTFTWCTDCHVVVPPNPCTGGGTGAWAFRVAGPVWTCPY